MYFRYMCQINTDPMKSQMGYLDVVGEWMFLGFEIKFRTALHIK